MASADTKPADEKPADQKPEQKTAALGEDDEFEDFPVDGRPASTAPAAAVYWPSLANLFPALCRLARGSDRGRAEQQRD